MTTNTALTGLRLDVLHSSFRDTLSVTQHLDHITLVGKVDTRTSEKIRVVQSLPRDCRGPFAPTPTAPAFALVIRTLFGNRAHLYLAPVLLDEAVGRYALPTDDLGPWMASGAFAKGDSRWTDLTGRYGYPFGVPVPLHDRHESWALYNAMASS